MGQVISILPNGEIQGLQYKPGKGLDLLSLPAQAHVVRASEILFDVDTQKWYVEFREGAGAYTGRLLDFSVVQECGEPLCDRNYDAAKHWSYSKPLSFVANFTYQFSSYDLAVEAEVDVLNCLRATGKI